MRSHAFSTDNADVILPFPRSRMARDFFAAYSDNMRKASDASVSSSIVMPSRLGVS